MQKTKRMLYLGITMLIMFSAFSLPGAIQSKMNDRPSAVVKSETINILEMEEISEPPELDLAIVYE